MDESKHIDEIERRLRQYRPVAPPAALRARIVAVERPSASSLWMWLPAAVSAAAALALMVLGSSARRDLASEFPKGDAGHSALVTAVAAELGGDATTRAIVARLIELDEQAAGADQAGPTQMESSRHE